jgi:hypothetical protein
MGGQSRGADPRRTAPAERRRDGGWPPPPQARDHADAPPEPRYERMPLVIPLGVLFVLAVAMASLFGRMFLIR